MILLIFMKFITYMNIITDITLSVVINFLTHYLHDMNNSYKFHDIYAGDEKLSINLNLNFQSYSINEQSTE